MRTSVLILLSLAAGCLFSARPGGLASKSPSAVPKHDVEVYFVRHGETVANATGKYNGSTLNKLSAVGEAEANAVARALKNTRFDAAWVSPSLRAELTAAPTLRDHHLVATIMPAFNECCTEHGAARLRAASKRLGRSATAQAPHELADVLRATDERTYAPANYADGITQTKIAAKELKDAADHGRFSRILIVGHSAQGSRFLDVLLGRKPIGDIEVKNGEVFVLRMQANGNFKLVRRIENPYSVKHEDPNMRTGRHR